MAEVDLEKVRMLADSAQSRATRCHALYFQCNMEAKTMYRKCHSNAGEAGEVNLDPWHLLDDAAHEHLNDYFYWIGHANAYKGIVAMAELQTVVEDELDAEGSCP